MPRRLSAAIALALVGGAIALTGCGQSHQDAMDKAVDNIEHARQEADRANAQLRQAGAP